MATAALKANDLTNELDLSESLPRATAPAGNPQTCVLLIEDNEEAMFLVRIALQEYGRGIYRLEWADGLSGGLERIAQGGVDLVLLDLGLPESSGPASYAWVRELAPEIPVLVLTGDTRVETEVTVLASGVEDYLIKDEISGSLLIQAIRAALRTSQRGDNRRLKLANGNNEIAGTPKLRTFVPTPPDCKN
jgi:DNA-binding response OmpR family regulator